jgi:hypothetical protein
MLSRKARTSFLRCAALVRSLTDRCHLQGGCSQLSQRPRLLEFFQHKFTGFNSIRTLIFSLNNIVPDARIATSFLPGLRILTWISFSQAIDLPLSQLPHIAPPLGSPPHPSQLFSPDIYSANDHSSFFGNLPPTVADSAFEWSFVWADIHQDGESKIKITTSATSGATLRLLI